MYRSNCSLEIQSVISGSSNKNLSPKRQINDTDEQMDLHSSLAKVKKPQNYYEIMPTTPTGTSELNSAMIDMDIGCRPHSQSVILGKQDIQERILAPTTKREKRPIVPLLPKLYANTTQYMQFANLINYTMSEMESMRDKN